MQKRNKKKIAIVCTDWNENEYRRKNKKYGGVSYYRLVKPMEFLKKKYKVDFIQSGFTEISKGMSTDQFYDWFTKEYDMIIIKSVDNAGAIQPLLHYGHLNKCIIVQDFDDNMLVIREDQPAHKHGYAENGHKRAYVAAMMSLVNAIIVSTDPLKDYFFNFLKDKFGEEKDIYVYPNYNDITDWDYPTPERDPNKIVIGWMGSITHDSDLSMMMPALGRVVDKYDNVYVELLGGTTQGNLGYLCQGWTQKAKDKIKTTFGCSAWDKYPELMRSQAWDIGLAPLIDDEFNRGKSHIKWMEYAMCGIPCIASDVYPYTKNIPEGCAILCKENEWETSLESLINDASLRKDIADNAFKHIKESKQWSQHGKEYLEIVHNIFEKHQVK